MNYLTNGTRDNGSFDSIEGRVNAVAYTNGRHEKLHLEIMYQLADEPTSFKQTRTLLYQGQALDHILTDFNLPRNLVAIRTTLMRIPVGLLFEGNNPVGFSLPETPISRKKDKK